MLQRDRGCRVYRMQHTRRLNFSFRTESPGAYALLDSLSLRFLLGFEPKEGVPDLFSAPQIWQPKRNTSSLSSRARGSVFSSNSLSEADGAGGVKSWSMCDMVAAAARTLLKCSTTLSSLSYIWCTRETFRLSQPADFGTGGAAFHKKSAMESVQAFDFIVVQASACEQQLCHRSSLFMSRTCVQIR